MTNNILKAKKALDGDLSNFISHGQKQCLLHLLKGEEGEFFANKVLDLEGITRTMPRPYQTDGQGKNAIAYLHYFIGNIDAWITERDMAGMQHQAFGMQSIGYEPEMGYISIVELLRSNAEIDLYWTPKSLKDINK